MRGLSPAMMLGLRLLALGATALLAGCGSDRLLGSSSSDPSPPPPPPPPNVRAGAKLTPTPPPIDMAGRWQLASTAGGACAMTFAGPPGSGEGTIAPEGGCPGNFFTSRRWVYDQGALVIRNHNGEPLARLAFSPPGRFEGQAAPGETVSLTR
jgi:Protease inhibitor Inh